MGAPKGNCNAAKDKAKCNHYKGKPAYSDKERAQILRHLKVKHIRSKKPPFIKPGAVSMGAKKYLRTISKIKW